MKRESHSSYAPLVSVIMNCYNGERFLEEAIQSVFGQTYQNWEIVFWDNASTDGSAAVAKKYLGKLKYFRAEQNVPLGAARNLAIQKAEGELVAFLDCDDIFLPERLERGVQVMADSKWAMCYAGVEEIRESGAHLRNVPTRHQSGDLLPALLKQFDVNIPTLLVRKSALAKHGLAFDPSYHASEEFNLFMRLASREPIATIREILAKWRCHGGSLTGKTISRWADERIRTLDQIAIECPEQFAKYRAAFEKAYARAYYYRACYLVSENQMAEARKAIFPAKKSGFAYRVLYWLAYLPRPVWTLVHHPVIKRKIIPRVLGLVR